MSSGSSPGSTTIVDGSNDFVDDVNMDQLVADNLVSWAAGKGPLTPVAETPVKK